MISLQDQEFKSREPRHSGLPQHPAGPFRCSMLSESAQDLGSGLVVNYHNSLAF